MSSRLGRASMSLHFKAWKMTHLRPQRSGSLDANLIIRPVARALCPRRSCRAALGASLLRRRLGLDHLPLASRMRRRPRSRVEVPRRHHGPSPRGSDTRATSVTSARPSAQPSAQPSAHPSLAALTLVAPGLSPTVAQVRTQRRACPDQATPSVQSLTQPWPRGMQRSPWGMQRSSRRSLMPTPPTSLLSLACR